MKNIIISVLFLLLCITTAIMVRLVHRPVVPYNVHDYESGKEYEMVLNGRTFFKVAVKNSGALDYFKNYCQHKNYQIFYFFEDGFLESLLQINQLDSLDGRAYYFYKNSGHLEKDIHYKNGIMSGYAITYFDSIPFPQEAMFVDSLGHILNKVTFDESSNIIDKEGFE